MAMDEIAKMQADYLAATVGTDEPDIICFPTYEHYVEVCLECGEMPVPVKIFNDALQVFSSKEEINGD